MVSKIEEQIFVKRRILFRFIKILFAIYDELCLPFMMVRTGQYPEKCKKRQMKTVPLN